MAQVGGELAGADPALAGQLVEQQRRLLVGRQLAAHERLGLHAVELRQARAAAASASSAQLGVRRSTGAKIRWVSGRMYSSSQARASSAAVAVLEQRGEHARHREEVARLRGCVGWRIRTRPFVAAREHGAEHGRFADVGLLLEADADVLAGPPSRRIRQRQRVGRGSGPSGRRGRRGQPVSEPTSVGQVCRAASRSASWPGSRGHVGLSLPVSPVLAVAVAPAAMSARTSRAAPAWPASGRSRRRRTSCASRRRARPARRRAGSSCCGRRRAARRSRGAP